MLGNLLNLAYVAVMGVFRGPVQLTIAYTATQFDFKWKAPSTSTLTFHWGDGTTSEVAGNDAVLVTTTSSYTGAGTYDFWITGDVADLTYIDISGQEFVSGDASGWSTLTNLTYISVSNTPITGSFNTWGTLVNVATAYIANTAQTGDVSNLATWTSCSIFSVRNNSGIAGDASALYTLSGNIYVDLTSVTFDNTTAFTNSGKVLSFHDCGMTSTMVDNVIAALKTCTSCTINIAGTNAHRTAASNDDLNTLLAAGNTITLNDVLGAELHTSLNAANDSATQAITAFSDYAATIDGATKVDSAIDFLDMVPQGSALNVSNCVNNNYTSFANGTPTGFDVTSDGTVAHFAGSADEISFIANKYYVASFALVLNSGTAPDVNIRLALGGAQLSGGAQTSSAGANKMVFKSVVGSYVGVLEFRNNSTATDFEVTNLSVKELEVLGSDLVTDGDMSNAASWDEGTGWEVTGGLATHTAGSAGELVQELGEGTGTFLAKFTISGRTAGIIEIGDDNGVLSSEFSTDGTYTAIFLNNTETNFITFFAGATFDGSIDNVSTHKLTFQKEIAASTNYTGTHYVLPIDENDFAIPVDYTAEGIVAQKFGGESNATTGFTQVGLDVGTNVFESQGAVKSTGSYALHADANDTPTATVRVEYEPTVDNGAVYRIEFDWRHIGSGGNWRFDVDGVDTGNLLLVGDTSFESVVWYTTAAGASIIYRWREASGTNNGGIYADNISVKKVTLS